MNTTEEKQLSLVSWIGHNDLRGMAVDQGGDMEAFVAEVTDRGDVSRLRRSAQGMGPLMTAWQKLPVARADLICTYPEALGNKYIEWLHSKKDCQIHPHYHPLENPTDYSGVYTIADSIFQKAFAEATKNDWRLCIHLSPGTPTMAAVSVLLGSTRYPAKLIQTFRDEVKTVALPFEIDVFVSEVFKEPDRLLAVAALSSPGEVEGFEDIVGESAAIREAVHRARRVAQRDINVLLTGETGTGKEMFARAIRNASKRREAPFVVVNCAAIPGTLFESEVFGYNKGAFTDAKEDHPGAFEQANEGILFLDEVGELPPEHQAKLLRALQPQPGDSPCTRTIRRLKATKDIEVDVRVIAATHRPLLGSDAGCDFRDDLYYRLATLTVALPPLRDRGADVRLLSQVFIGELNRRFAKDEKGYRDKSIAAPAQRALSRYAWPGNVRELHNVLVQAAVMCETDAIGERDIRQALACIETKTDGQDVPFKREDGFKLEVHIDAIRRRLVEDALHETDNKNNAAAALLGIASSTMSKYRRRYGLTAD